MAVISSTHLVSKAYVYGSFKLLMKQQIVEAFTLSTPNLRSYWTGSTQNPFYLGFNKDSSPIIGYFDLSISILLISLSDLIICFKGFPEIHERLI